MIRITGTDDHDPPECMITINGLDDHDQTESVITIDRNAQTVAVLRESGGLQDMQVVGGHTLIALDGTEFHCSDKIQCPNCSHRQRRRKGTEYLRTLLAATIVAPGHIRAVPLELEFMAPQDGHEKQDCESRGRAAGWPRTAPNMAR